MAEIFEIDRTILSMKNNISGYIDINNKEINFNNNDGYVEKDRGYSFPRSYI